jgi:O-acetyl-ADP-ribose deacetylase (regulator of RNase III)
MVRFEVSLGDAWREDVDAIVVAASSTSPAVRAARDTPLVVIEIDVPPDPSRDTFDIHLRSEYGRAMDEVRRAGARRVAIEPVGMSPGGAGAYRAANIAVRSVRDALFPRPTVELVRFVCRARRQLDALRQALAAAALNRRPYRE